MVWTAPRTWVAGEVVTAGLLNTHVRDNLLAVGDPGAWTAYTPVLTGSSSNPTLGSGSVQSGWYKILGKTCFFKATIRFGSSGAAFGAGAYLVSIPQTAHANYAFSGGQHMFGSALLTDDSAGISYSGSARPFDNGKVFINTHGTTATSPTVPFTFAVSDYIQVEGHYEIA